MRSAVGLLLLILAITAVVLAETKPTAGAGKQIFVANCANCHGPDGKGNSTGRAMGVKDLHSPEVIKLTDAQMKTVIANGKNNMPPWKGQLSAAQISEVAAFVRTLQKTKAK
jgi:cytochrome c oxidase cbb3-type subunit 3